MKRPENPPGYVNELTLFFFLTTFLYTEEIYIFLLSTIGPTSLALEITTSV